MTSAWQPKALTSETQRSPNLPAVRTRTRSPGDVRLETEASMAPVPPLERMMTSFLVPTNSFSCAKTRVEGAELGGAVVDVGGGHGELRGGEEGRRAWSEETSFTDHGFILAASCRTGPLRAGRPLRGGYTGRGDVGGMGPRVARRIPIMRGLFDGEDCDDD